MRPILLLCLFGAGLTTAPAAAPYGIQVVDAATGRGVPLMTLTTVNEIALVTDGAGWVAFDEPGLLGQKVFFSVSGPGYEKTKDGFGFAGVALPTEPGGRGRIEVQRTQPAERLSRLSGQGIYADSTRLGLPTPLPEPLLNAGVMGLDSVQVTPYRGRLFWIWGDTQLPPYPLGHFHATGAFSDLPERGGLPPDQGVRFDYLTQPDGRVQKMAPMDKEGPVWLFGLLTVEEADGEEVMIAHYSRHKNLAEVLEHGLMRFDPESRQFKVEKELPASNTWRYPRGHALRVRSDAGDWFYFCDPFPTTRVPARLASVLDPEAYEALAFDGTSETWRWQKQDEPATQESELALLRSGKLSKEQTRLQLHDAQGKPLIAHGGTTQWNPFRQRWLTLFLQKGGKESLIGEVWLAESRDLDGPRGPAVKVASHPKYSFYNIAHHPFFDQDKGRLIHFEGTYTRTFSGNPVPTPRYEYNQLLYRVDLDLPELKAARVP